MAVAVVGVLAGFLVLGGNPGATQAHGGPNDDTHCDGMSLPQKIQHDVQSDDGTATAHTCDDPTDAPPAATTGVTPEPVSAPERYDIDALASSGYEVSDDADGNSVATINASDERSFPIEEVVRFQVSADDEFGRPLGVGAEDVTVTVKVTESRTGMVQDSTGLDSSGIGTGVSLQGLLTIRGVDNGQRNFSLDVECQANNEKVEIDILDDELTLVAEASIICGVEAEVLPGDATSEDCYSVTGYVDEMQDDLVLVEDDTTRTVNSSRAMKGIYKDADGILDIRNRRGEAGQDTTEVLVGSDDVQLTVTSCEPGPVYIRFLDENMEVFGTDVDEDPAEAGADVVGLDSQQKLEMNLEKDLDAAMALAYDQYTLVETLTRDDDGNAVRNSQDELLWVQYLSGKAGTYQQGKFRFNNPCAAVGDHFFVEVYEQFEKDIRYLENGKTYEKVTCVPSLQPEANELRVSFDTADVTDANTGTAVVTWETIDDAAVYTVAVIDTSNSAMFTIHGTPAMVTVTAGDPEANRTARFPGIVSGQRYIFAVYAKVTGGGYSALRSVILTPEFVSN